MQLSEQSDNTNVSDNKDSSNIISEEKLCRLEGERKCKVHVDMHASWLAKVIVLSFSQW
jgi:hypothetical protein